MRIKKNIPGVDKVKPRVRFKSSLYINLSALDAGILIMVQQVKA